MFMMNHMCLGDNLLNDVCSILRGVIYRYVYYICLCVLHESRAARCVYLFDLSIRMRSNIGRQNKSVREWGKF